MARSDETVDIVRQLLPVIVLPGGCEHEIRFRAALNIEEGSVLDVGVYGQRAGVVHRAQVERHILRRYLRRLFRRGGI